MRIGIVFLSLLVLLAATIPVPAHGNTNVPAGLLKQIHTISPLCTGNGFGYAVVATTGEVVKFYAHPYRFERANSDVSKDGYETANFLKTLSFTGKDSTAKVEYKNESQIITVKKPGLEQIYFMPFGLKHNAFVALRSGQPKDKVCQLKAVWQHTIEHEEQKEISRRKVRLLTFRDVKELLAIVPLDAKAATTTSAELMPWQSWAFLVLESPEQAEKAVNDLLAWHGGLNADELVQRELKHLESWRVKPTVHFLSEKEERLWRQNETILKMSQIQEANTAKRFNHGLILASLPDGVWFTPWVRDMSYALVGLVRMGHNAEAREGIMSWFNARPVGLWKHETRNLDYQISVVRYYGDGSEEADYSGQKTANVEFDDWGLALWSISEYWQATHDNGLLAASTYRGTVYDTMRDFIVKPLLGNLDKYDDGLIVAEDSSCWEEHQENKRHYACSTIAAIPGLRGFQKIAEAMHDEETAQMLAAKIKLLENGFKKAFVRDGALTGVVETNTQPKSETDGAILEAFNLNLVDDPSVVEKTLQKIEKLKTASGGYRRNLGPSDYEAHEFVFIDFNLARVLMKMGKSAEAAKILETIVDKSSQDNGLIAEMYVSEKNRGSAGEIGDPAGAIPMVGYGAGVYAIALSDRERFSKH